MIRKISLSQSFLENDSKTIFKEKRVLETKRLDLDAAKAKLKKVKTLEARDQVEQEVRNLQVIFNQNLQNFYSRFKL